MTARRNEADAFYAAKIGPLTADERTVARQAYAGLLWSKQFYHYDVRTGSTATRRSRRRRQSASDGRNTDWTHLYNRDVISMPDKWEYPWFAAWDLAFHMLPFARIDPALRQGAAACCSCASGTCTRTGSCPRTSSAFGDVNPPVHAWAAWRVVQDRGAARARATRRSWRASSRSCCSTSRGG